MLRAMFSVPCVIVSAFAIAGCSEGEASRYQVMGTVSFDGKPVEQGDILFMPVEPGPPVDGGKINNGEYSVDVSPGAKKVVIRAVREHPTETMPGIEPGTVEPVQEEYIPNKYNRDTELEANIQEDKVLDFPLAP